MLRKIVFAFMLLGSVGALAESMDDVLKSNHVTAEQLDQTAEQVISESDIPVAAKAERPAVAKADAPKVVKAKTSEKQLSESEIPVLQKEKAEKTSQSSPWARLIGMFAFVLVFSAAAFIFLKKASKQKSVGGKKAKIEILHQHHLGPKKSLALIQVAGEAILVGITDHNINMIKAVALIDDEMAGEPQDFHGFLDDEFTVEQLTAQKSRTRLI